MADEQNESVVGIWQPEKNLIQFNSLFIGFNVAALFRSCGGIIARGDSEILELFIAE